MENKHLCSESRNNDLDKHLCSEVEINKLEEQLCSEIRINKKLGKVITELKESKMFSAYQICDNTGDRFTIIKLQIDFEKMSEFEETYPLENAVAIKSKDFGFGVWFGENEGIRLYGKCNMSNAFFGLYWLDQYEIMKDIVEQSIEKAGSKEDLFNGLATIIMDAIDAYIAITGDVVWLDQQKYQELLRTDKMLEGD